MSRPRKAHDERRTHSVTFWLTPDEFAQLQGAAERAGVRANELARRLTQRGRLRLVIQATRRTDPAFLAQVRALGVNLNQLVKAAHLRGQVSPKIEEVCDEIRRVVLAAVEDEA